MPQTREINKVREIDPFFDEAVNYIFKEPSNTAFIMDGPVGLGKSSNFVIRGAIEISSCVAPIKKGNRQVRESKWAAIRESENSARATIMQLLEEAVFSPEIIALKDSPVKIYGSHPTTIAVSHLLADGTYLDMKIECHGFNNTKAKDRLKTHEFLGCLVFEMQAIPYDVFETAIERSGRYRTNSMTITKKIDGKEYKLSGQTQLSIVLADVNIPSRPHPLYDNIYDIINKDEIPYKLITLPSPLIHKPVDSVPEEILDKYKTTIFEGEEVVWLPNPKVYNMTVHFEEVDNEGKRVPWTGYNYWFSMVHKSDSIVRRYVLGIPDSVGGESAIYKRFDRDDKDVVNRVKPPSFGETVYLGFDPGGYAAVVMATIRENFRLNFFKEFIFEPADGVSTRGIFRDFIFPYARKHLQGCNVVWIPDPASTHLGKSIMAGQSESVVNMINDEIASELKKHIDVKYKMQMCFVSNQETDTRISSLGYYIEQNLISIDHSLEWLIGALSGQYRRKVLASGSISESIDKNEWSHVAEAAQYIAVNTLIEMKKRKYNGKRKNKRRVYKVTARR